MLVIRRLVDRHRAYTGMFLPGEPPRIFPTTDHEHARILRIYKQDKAYEDVINDFTEDLPPRPVSGSADSSQKKHTRPQHRQVRKQRRP